MDLAENFQAMDDGLPSTAQGDPSLHVLRAHPRLNNPTHNLNKTLVVCSSVSH